MKISIHILTAIVIGMLLEGCADLTNASNVTVTAQCPTTISKGQYLTIELQLKNTTSSSVAIAKSGLVASFGGLNVVGPLAFPLSKTLAAGQVITTSGFLNVSLPAQAASGSFMGIGIGVLDSANKVNGIGGCLIQVL
jgi:hypothetical protein